LPLADPGKPARLLNSAHNEYDAQFSPDGKWIAYASDDSGSPEVYVQRFQGVPPATGPRWQISQHGGGKPKWRRDGNELFFLAPDGQLMAAAAKSDSSILQPGDPERLFPTRLNMIEPGQQYTPAPDGKGFFVLQLTAGPSQPLVVVSNWSQNKP
jgi:eukaryotic-like serine/threonine-protein kinase